MPNHVRRVTVDTSRGSFAALAAKPASGISERQPALLVPGYTGSKEDFLSVLESLAAAGRFVVAIDMRGQYHSPAAESASGYGIDQLASDLAAVATVIAGDSGRVHLLGHSFGGLVAREAALGAPNAFLSLALLGSGPYAIGGDRAQALRDLLGYLRPADGDTEQMRTMITQLWDTRLRPQAEAEGTPQEVIGFLADRTALTCPLGLAVMAGQLLGCPDRTAELAALGQLPKLVSYGENDDAWPPDVQDLMAKRLGAERVCIPGAAHSPAVEAPETTAAMLTTFWNQAELSGSALTISCRGGSRHRVGGDLVCRQPVPRLSLRRGGASLRALRAEVTPAAPVTGIGREYLVTAPRLGIGLEPRVRRLALGGDILGPPQLPPKRLWRVVPAHDLAGRQVMQFHRGARPAQHPARRDRVQRERQR